MWWNFPKKAWLIIIAEIGVIAGLSGLLYSTYLNNVYFQTYVDSLSPVLVPILSIAFGITSASIATYLYLGMKRVRISQEQAPPVNKKRIQRRKTSKQLPQRSTSQPKVAELLQTNSSKLKPITPPQSHVQSPKPLLREREDQNSNSENRKPP